MRAVVISQPMLFPWVGMFEQLRLADVFVHYDDVQFSKGSFTNRVQVKTASGIKWLTVPLPGLTLGQRIGEIPVAPCADWGRRHIALLEQAYDRAPWRHEMLDLVSGVYSETFATLADLSVASMDAVRTYFGMAGTTAFVRSSSLGVPGRSDSRVLAIVERFGGDCYITGHGARNYLDHELIEAAGVQVMYQDYQKHPYTQLHGPFTPYVSVLDLIANCGPGGVDVIQSPAIPWRKFLERSCA